MNKILVIIYGLCFLTTVSAVAQNANNIILPKPKSVVMTIGSVSLDKSISLEQIKE